MPICLVCGKYEGIELDEAMHDGWIFTRCPECHRGTPLDIAKIYLSKTIGEKNIEGFCSKHWFKDSGICGYCRMKRERLTEPVA